MRNRYLEYESNFKNYYKQLQGIGEEFTRIKTNTHLTVETKVEKFKECEKKRKAVFKKIEESIEKLDDIRFFRPKVQNELRQLALMNAAMIEINKLKREMLDLNNGLRGDIVLMKHTSPKLFKRSRP